MSMNTEQCEEWLQQYTLELNNALAEKQRLMPTPKTHPSYSNVAAINHQSNPYFKQKEVILARVTDFVNYVEHFHMMNKQVTFKSLLNLYLVKVHKIQFRSFIKLLFFHLKYNCESFKPFMSK